MSLLMAIWTAASLSANPLPPCRIEYVKAFPPEIGVMFYFDSLDISGETISTMGGTAVIGQYDPPGLFEMVIFDSSNTTGFAIDPEGDMIEIASQYTFVNFGNCGYSPPPIMGHNIRFAFGYPWDDWTFDFTNTQWGQTEIVINEINANGDWTAESNFIELYNQAADALDISGWMIICDTISVIPQNTVIEGHGFYAMDQCNFPDMFDMDFDGDNIYLIRADSVLVDEVGWSSDHGTNISFMRYPDGDVDNSNYLLGYRGYNDNFSYTFENGFPSRCAPNRHDSPGFVVIGTHGRNESGNVDLRWTDPIWDPNFEYSFAVRNFDHYPQEIIDGEIVYQGTEQNVIDMVPAGNYGAYYTIFARNAGGGYSIPTDESRAYVILEPVGINGNPDLPENISSLSCYPNPFNASVTIGFVLNRAGSVSLSVYNLQGQRVETLFESSKSAGEHRITWDGSNYPSGIYFARLWAGSVSKSVKMVLLK